MNGEDLTLTEEIAKARVLHAFLPESDTRTKNQFTADSLTEAGYVKTVAFENVDDAIAWLHEPEPITDAQVEAAWKAGAAVFGDYEPPGGRDLRAMRRALEAARDA